MDENKINNPSEKASAAFSEAENTPITEITVEAVTETANESQAEQDAAVEAPEIRYAYRWNYESQNLHDNEQAKNRM
jgi:hypothetical protein